MNTEPSETAETIAEAQPLTHDQRVTMNETIREYNRKGQPERAEPYRIALANNVMYVEPEVDDSAEVEVVPQPAKSSKKEVWQAYAIEISDIDPEVINNASRKDVITMLVVNELIERP